ncbi:hypothetical protein CISG_05181 [Coccidioides immitis RMSCC 3703]|uniref:Uncharacterized protein n=2 Tax=Coccidioides immitis TaxID=5501 RepID=A0A0J8QSK5_COCIT|nr:hypothetical protein CISG_05181 [Coccidioides immitis RMSCC 3703]
MLALLEISVSLSLLSFRAKRLSDDEFAAEKGPAMTEMFSPLLRRPFLLPCCNQWIVPLITVDTTGISDAAAKIALVDSFFAITREARRGISYSESESSPRVDQTSLVARTRSRSHQCAYLVGEMQSARNRNQSFSSVEAAVFPIKKPTDNPLIVLLFYDNIIRTEVTMGEDDCRRRRPKVTPKDEDEDIRAFLRASDSVEVVFSLSEAVLNLLGVPRNTESTPNDLSERLVHVVQAGEIIWKAPFARQKKVFKCGHNIAVKAVRGMEDYTEYTTLKYIQQHKPSIPAADRKAW